MQDFVSMRLEAFRNWCATAALPNISPDNFTGIFRYVLSKQGDSGAWTGDHVWETVMTAVVLKSLALLKFRPEDSWSFTFNDEAASGSVEAGLRYLREQLTGKYTEAVGEGIWDPCQALLAVAAFGDRQVGLTHVERIAREWKLLYARASETEGRWNGPGYLAAITDVLMCYGPELEGRADIEEVAAALMACEQVTNGQPSGAFHAIGNDRNVNRWTTAVVLRTLSALPQPNVSLIERSVNWLLVELADRGWETDIREAPMFIARCLDGISRARNLVTSDLRIRIDAEIAHSNRKLMSYWSENPDVRRGSLKAYTAVGEYLASTTIPTPAGLVFDLAEATTPRVGGTAATRTQLPGIFVVHGRNMAPVRDLQAYVQNVLGLGNPTILRDQQSGGATVIEKFEREAAAVGLVFVVITPDDVGNLANETTPSQRARQNVIFELGYFIGKLGRTSGRLILLSSGDVELPSDITGVIQIDIRNGVEAAGEEIRRELGSKLEELRALYRAHHSSLAFN